MRQKYKMNKQFPKAHFALKSRDKKQQKTIVIPLIF